MSYISAAQLLGTLGVSSPSSSQTSDATGAVNAASQAIDNLCQRKGTTSRGAFEQDSSASNVRYYTPDTKWRLDIDDVVTVTSVVSRDDGGNVDTADSGLQTWTVNTDYVLEDMNAAAEGWPYSALRVAPTGSYVFNTIFPRSVKVTGKFGWPAVPAPVVDACTLLAERIYKMKREAPLGTIAMADMAVHIARADSNLMILLAPYLNHMVSVA